MKKLFIVFFILLSLAQNKVSAQKEGNIWYFGSHAGLDFNNDSVAVLENSAMWDNDNSSTISNAAGELLFYTNSDTVWNSLHEIMVNGTGLAGNTSAGQCAIIVPQTGTTKFFVFTNSPFGWAPGLNYSIVDIADRNKYGEVILKNIPLLPYSTEKLEAIYNQSDNSYWIITHPFESTYFFVYKLASGGLLPDPVISEPCALYSGGLSTGYNAVGQMTISPDGKTLASGVLSDGFIELCDFDMATGYISNSRIIPDFPDAWGIAFSPNSQNLYATRWWTDTVVRFSLADTTLSSIIASKTVIGSATASNGYGYQAGYMQLGPDNRIYITRYQTHYLAVINYPDLNSPECGFVNDGVFLGSGTSMAGLSRVPVKPSTLTAADNARMKKSSVNIFPNPSNGSFRMKCSDFATGSVLVMDITDIAGKLLIHQQIIYNGAETLSFRELRSGLYTVKINTGSEVYFQKICIY